jgi:hypothetical protein
MSGDIDRPESVGNVESVSVFSTNDMSFAAYLIMKGVRLISAQRLGKSFQFKFIHDSKIERYSIEYVGSEVSRFDDAVRKLKRALKENGGI